VANIKGHGSILIKCKTSGHKALIGVYYIPRLTSNIISLSQLEEATYKIVLHDGFLRLWDRVKQAVHPLPQRQSSCVSGGTRHNSGMALAFKVWAYEFS
jgi:hypothetical protein